MRFLKILLGLIVVFVVLPVVVLLFTPEPAIVYNESDKFKSVGVKIDAGVYKEREAAIVTFDQYGFYAFSGFAKSIVGLKSNFNNSVALIKGSEFTNGSIDVDIAGTIEQDSFGAARGFAGVSFRTSQALDHYEVVYLRPANGRVDDPVRAAHALQYGAHPDFHFNVSRKTAPGKYETGADIALGEWIHLRIEVDGDKATILVDGKELLKVDDLRHGADGKGGIGFWVGMGTKAFFSNLVVTPKP